MKAISDLMLDAPYVSDPLGEGHGYDADPLTRYDVFDCLTFVEEVLSLSLAGDPEHAAEVRLDLRYGSQSPNYAARRHFMELQWLPGTIGSGWVRDTTTRYGPTRHFEKQVDLAMWEAWGKRDNFSMVPDEHLPMGVISLDVLEIDDALAVIDDIPPGSIILTVREDRPSNPLWISHVGFLVPSEQPTVRHATRMGSVPRVRDHSFRWYLENMKRYRGWKAVGISILEPVEQGPRLSLMPDDG